MKNVYLFASILFAALILMSLWHGLSGIHMANSAKTRRVLRSDLESNRHSAVLWLVCGSWQSG
jgi:hypothetical protein